MSIGAERKRPVELSGPWDRLERVAEESAVAVAFWRRRALEAEEEIGRLRRALEEVSAGERERPDDVLEALRRSRAENAALRSRLLQARKRVQMVLRRLVATGIEP